MKARARNKKKAGRPAVITPAVVEAVGELMALGVPEEYACTLQGVKPATFGPAVCRNPDFKAIMMRHHAQFMADSLRIIKEGGEKVTLDAGLDKAGNPVTEEKVLPWTGRAWILERRYKPHFTKTEVHKPGEGKGEQGGLMSEAEMLQLEQMTRALVKGERS